MKITTRFLSSICLVLPCIAGGTSVIAAEPAPPAAVKSPEIEVWLLRADGSRIPWLRRWESPAYEDPNMRGRQIGAEVNFSFPLTAGNEAVTAAIQIGTELFIEQLRPLGKD